METNLYQQAILDAAKAATAQGELAQAHASIELDNPLCGDRVRMDLRMIGDRVEQIAHRVRGCLLCEASASVIGASAVGERAADLDALAVDLRRTLESNDGTPRLRWPSLEMFLPVCGYRSRHDCVMLPFDALVKVLSRASSHNR